MGRRSHAATALWLRVAKEALDQRIEQSLKSKAVSRAEPVPRLLPHFKARFDHYALTILLAFQATFLNAFKFGVLKLDYATLRPGGIGRPW